MRIEAIEISNFKAFQNANIRNVGSLGVFLGENGAGKTTLFDIFSFIKDCLTENVSSALQKRGGYDEVHSRNADGDIRFLFKYRPQSKCPLCIYELQIGLDKNRNPIINKEKLGDIINFSKGKGEAKGEKLSLAASDILAIKSLGQMAKFKSAVEFRKFLEDWFVADFQIDKMRFAQETSPSERLSRNGENIANVTQYLYNQHKDKFNSILKKMQSRIPGIKKVEAKTTEDGNILLKFHDGRFRDPFSAKYVSDGTIKMFAYLVMLANPNPYKLLCIEEPENQLYPHLLEILVEEFREYAHAGGQVLISSHSSDLVNALEPHELFILKKQIDGYSEIKSVAGSEQIVAFFNAGDKLGRLWKQKLLGNI
jgi:predicted ATPase